MLTLYQKMYEIDEKSGEEVPLIVLKQNDIVNEEQFLLNHSPLYSTKCLSQTAQVLYINKEDFITKILNDKLTYQKVIKQIENKQSLLKAKLEKIKINGQFSNYASNKNSNSDYKNYQQIQEDYADKYASPQFQQTNTSQEDAISNNQDKIQYQKKTNNLEKQFQSVRSTSFFEISFSEDRFYNSHEMPTSNFLKYETQDKENDKQQNFYNLDTNSFSQHSSQKSLDSISQKEVENNNYFSFKQQSDHLSSTQKQEAHMLENIKECSDDIRSSENMNYQTISDVEEGQGESYCQQQFLKIQQQSQNEHYEVLLQNEQKMQIQRSNADQDSSNEQKLQNYIENNSIKNQFGVQKIEDCIQMLNINFNRNKFEEQFQYFNQQTLSDKMSEQKQKPVEGEELLYESQFQNQQFFGQVLVDSNVFNAFSKRDKNEQVDTEDFRNQSYSERQDSLFDVSQEGLNSSQGQEEINIIQKEQLVQANLTRHRQFMGSISNVDDINNIKIYQSMSLSKKSSEEHQLVLHNNNFPDENLDIMIELNYFNTNQDNNQNIKICDQEVEEEEEKNEKFSPLKEKYLQKIKSKQLSQHNYNSLGSSPMKKSLSNYKKLLSHKLNEFIEGEDGKNQQQNGDKNLQFQSLQQTIQIPQLQKQISGLENSENKQANNYHQFMSPVEQKFTLSTQISPRISSCQDVGNRAVEDQFNLSQLSSCNGAPLLTNFGTLGLNNIQVSTYKESSSLSSSKQQFSDFKSNQIYGDINKNDALEVNQNIQKNKRNSLLTSSNESEQYEENYGISQKQISNIIKKKNQMQSSEQLTSQQLSQDKNSLVNIKQSLQASQNIIMKRNQNQTSQQQDSFKESINKIQKNQSYKEFEIQSIKELNDKSHQDNKTSNDYAELNNQDIQCIQNIPTHLIKNQEEKADLTQQQQEVFQKYFTDYTSSDNAIISTSNKLSNQQKSAYQKFLIHTQEAAKTLSSNLNKQQYPNHEQISNKQELIKKQQSLNMNQSNGLNYLKNNIAKLKQTEKKLIQQQNSYFINNIFGKSSKDQKILQKEDNSQQTIKNSQSINNLNNQVSVKSQQSKDTQNGIHHRIIKQTAPEIFKKGAEKVNQNFRSKSSLIANNNINSNNVNEKTISFNQMYSLYKNSVNKNTSTSTLGNQVNHNSKINSRAPSLSNLCKSKSQDLNANQKINGNIMNFKGEDIYIKYSQMKETLNKEISIKNIQNKGDMSTDNVIKINQTNDKQIKEKIIRDSTNTDILVNDYLIKENQLKDHFYKDSQNKDNKDHQNKDISPQSCKQLTRKNSTSLVKRKDVHQGSPFSNVKKSEQVQRSANPSPLRKVSSPQNNIRLHQNYMTQNNNSNKNKDKDNKNLQYNQSIRRSTNPELSRTKVEKAINMYQKSFESKPKILLQKDFENFEQSFKYYHKINKNQQVNDCLSHSHDSSLENGILTYLLMNNQIQDSQNPKMYTSLLSSLMNDTQQQQSQSLLEQLQQNRKNSGLQNIKKIIYSQMKENNNEQEEKKNKNIVNILSCLDESKESNTQNNLIKQIYSKRFSQIN